MWMPIATWCVAVRWTGGVWPPRGATGASDSGQAGGPFPVDMARARADARNTLNSIDWSKKDIVIFVPGTSNHTVSPWFEAAVKASWSNGGVSLTKLTKAQLRDGNGGAQLDGLTGAQRDALLKDTPLWFYVLREAEVGGGKLGGVGGLAPDVAFLA